MGCSRFLKVENPKVVICTDDEVDKDYVESWGCEVLNHRSTGDGLFHFEIFDINIPKGQIGKFKVYMHHSKYGDDIVYEGDI